MVHERRTFSPVSGAVTKPVGLAQTAHTAPAAEPSEPGPYRAIARQVIRLRACHGLSQEELAARIGSSHSQISRIESGQHRSSVETLRRIAVAFDTDLVVTFEPRVTT